MRRGPANIARVSQPVASILHQETIRRLSGDGAFDRGKKYFDEGRVTNVERREGSVHAKVRGAEPTPYAVRIWMKDGTVAYSCSCPQGQEQAFCKHAVALALASVGGLSEIAIAQRDLPGLEREALAPLARARAADPEPAPPKADEAPRATGRFTPTPAPAPQRAAEGSRSSPHPSLVDALRTLPQSELVVLVLEAALDHPAFRERLVERLGRG